MLITNLEELFFWDISLSPSSLFWPTFPYINSLMSLGTMVMKEVVEFVFVNHVHLASLCKSTPCIISPCGDVPNHTISQAFAWYVHIKIILWSHILARDTRNSTHGYITLQCIFLKISRIKVPISWSISHGRPWIRLTSNFVKIDHLDVFKYKTPWLFGIVPSTNCWNTNPQVVNNMSHANNQRKTLLDVACVIEGCCHC